MKITHNIIKYLALAFALFIIVSIVSLFVSIFTIFEDNNKVEIIDKNSINETIDDLELKLKRTNLIIKKGEKFDISTDNAYVKYNISNGKLHIIETKTNLKNRTYNLTLIIPEDLKKLSLESGAGTVDISDINFDEGNFELGAGKVDIKNMQVNKKIKLETGAGTITIDNSIINNLDLEMGIGKVELNTELKGKTKIEAGIGSLNLNLIGNDYEYNIEKGIGTIKYNGAEVRNNKKIGTGTNSIEIEGGIGSINIKDEVNHEETI